MWSSSQETEPQYPSSTSSLPPSRKSFSAKLGPPRYIKPRLYPVGLEKSENNANLLLVEEYEEDIHKHYVTLEETSKINPEMIDLQPEIEWFMRPYLLDFLIEMHSSFKLKPQTLFLCTNIIDRYCARRIVFKQHYQLIGCTAMWMAAKYEDKKSRVPTLRELSLMCRSVYDESMFKEMEMHMLSTLDWSLGHVTLEDCLQLSLKTSKQVQTIPSELPKPAVENAIIAILRYLCELSLFQRSFLLYPTSLVAISAHLLASQIVNDHNASHLIAQISRQQPVRDHFNDLYNDEELTDDDDQMLDEDAENTKPHPKVPFIAGFEGEKTIDQIRQLSLLFINAINSPSDILVNKYTPLGVINVVNGFLQKHYTFLQHSITMVNLKELKVEDIQISSHPQLYQLTELLLGLSTAMPPAPFAPPPPTLHHYVASASSPPPLTPSSSTSQYSSSIFSSGLKTPTFVAGATKYPHINSTSTTASSLVNTASAKHSHYQTQKKKIVYPNSSPVADMSSSPPIDVVYNNERDEIEILDQENHHLDHAFEKPLRPASKPTTLLYYTAYSSDPASSPLASHQTNQNMIF